MAPATQTYTNVAIVTAAGSGIGLVPTYSLLSHNPPYRVAGLDIKEIPPAFDLACTDINSKGVVYDTQLAIHFVHQNSIPGGQFVGTASSIGIRRRAALLKYAGTKAAVIVFCLATAPILQIKDHITFNVHMTDLNTVARAYHRYLDARNLNGEIAEASVDQVLVGRTRCMGME
ncbi:hypothetical protein DV736_g1345, partial [Chaetothyriales sp. CBS 134916]